MIWRPPISRRVLVRRPAVAAGAAALVLFASSCAGAQRSDSLPPEPSVLDRTSRELVLGTALSAHRGLRGSGVVVACSLTSVLGDTAWTPSPAWPRVFGTRKEPQGCHSVLGERSGERSVFVERVSPHTGVPWRGANDVTLVRFEVRPAAPGSGTGRWWEEYVIGRIPTAGGTGVWEVLMYRRATNNQRDRTGPT
jgi:hypothetical protein